MTLEEALLSVFRQVMVDKPDTVELAGQEYPVRRTPKYGLRQVDFPFDGHQLRGLEQNPQTKSRWAQLARAGKPVMQFLEAGRYIGVVAAGKLTLYSSTRKMSERNKVLYPIHVAGLRTKHLPIFRITDGRDNVADDPRRPGH